jgi:spore photoproduct lyase
MKRHKHTGLSVADNPEHILTEINSHAMFAQVDKPNQTDPEYITYDIACNEDFALHAKYHNWEKIFQFFVDHPRAKATFATKIIPEEFLKFNPSKKVRIRFSLMPQKIADQLEPNTPLIEDRIKAVNRFADAGYEVHLNYSPVVVYPGWEHDYTKLFKMVDNHVADIHKEDVLAEVIFLTHNKGKHEYNLTNNLTGEDLLWRPDIQENKISQYGGENLRYKYELKREYISNFKELHAITIPWNKIRYIF